MKDLFLNLKNVEIIPNQSPNAKFLFDKFGETPND
jgi:hypothetical protein